ncbi:hypothetical protein OPT61_g10176 [Boeremia exigua]|uniref:Uncharacterized protein n=1 Tax=Boeremia exigua TaxID=749465 RepID=A0ACC2HQW1_9PLEO|nr:hypothetical protein OPT61_g10176 [Boeremia exigua]
MKSLFLPLSLGVVLPSTLASAAYDDGIQEPMRNAIDPNKYRAACPDYKQYSMRPHPPYSEGPLELPFQRPSKYCRTFESPSVETVIENMNKNMVDKDLARIFENAFPNTLDTTVRWHVDTTPPHRYGQRNWDRDAWIGPQSFIVTGDINAEWLRDSTNQLQQYQPLAKKDKEIFKLIQGAINTQAEYVIGSPYCNAFQPPIPSNLDPTHQDQPDVVHPEYEASFVFECKYELDSLAHFLSLANQFHHHTSSTTFITARWLQALDTLLTVLTEQSRPTFDEKTGAYRKNTYTFQRRTDIGTETLALSGVGNPPRQRHGSRALCFPPQRRRYDSWVFADQLAAWAERIKAGVWEHGVITHKKYGRVFAFEVDGYGSSILMDDANLPSLLALPLLGFVDADDEVYRNTRRMILERQGNPYFLSGAGFSGIGGPHIGLQHAWPMSVLVQAMTSEDDVEILWLLESVKNVSRNGLIHESIHVDYERDYTRPWFAWANSVFAQTILDLAKRKPHLLFGKGAEPYTLG